MDSKQLVLVLAFVPMALAAVYDGVDYPDLASALSVACQGRELRSLERKQTLHLNHHSYQLRETIHLSSCHNHLIIQGLPSNDTVLEAGTQLHPFQPTSTAGIYAAAVPSSFTGQAMQLWLDGERQTLANSGTLIYNHTGGPEQSYEIVTQPSQLPLFANASNLEVEVFHSWTASLHRVRNISSNVINVVNPVNSHFDHAGLNGGSGNRYVVYNAVEYVTPGSGMFYHDQNKGVVFFAPKQGRDPTQAVAMVGNISVAIMAQDVDDITLQDITVQHTRRSMDGCFRGTCDGQSASFTTDAVIWLRNASRVTLRNITVQRTGNYGVWIGDFSRDVTLTHSTLTDLGVGGVRVGPNSGGVPTGNAQAVRILVSDNVISNGGHVIKEGCGVLAQACVNSTITHNNITDLFYTGVSLGWTWSYSTTVNGGNEVSYNRIHTIGKNMLSDMGCIYHLGPTFGTSINNNLCSNVTSFNYGGWGLYLDQASTHVTLENNIVWDTKYGGFHQHYGMDNVLRNNIFARVDFSLLDGGIRSSTHNKPGDEGDMSSFAFNHNIVAVTHNPIFFATTNRSFANETLNNNTYWVYDPQAHQPVGFPCDPHHPYGGKFWLENGEGIVVGDPLYSDNHAYRAQVSSQGPFCIVRNSDNITIWCVNNTLPQPSMQTEADMQSDGNFCVHAPSKVLWCDMTSVKGPGYYYAALNNNGSFCVHQGVNPYADQGSLWCTPQDPSSAASMLGFGTDCSFASWQQQGQDTLSIVADPLFVDYNGGDLTLQPSLCSGLPTH